MPFTMDDLRIKYSEFSTNFGITEKDAPALFAYLSKRKDEAESKRFRYDENGDDGDKKNDNPDSEDEEEDEEGKNEEEDGDTMDEGPGYDQNLDNSTKSR